MTQDQETLIRFVAKGQAAQAAADALTAPAEGKRFADAQHPAGFPKPNHNTTSGAQWFVTFPLNDTHRSGCYALLEARDYGGAREEAFERFGAAWGFIYDITDLPAQISAYHLREVK